MNSYFHQGYELVIVKDNCIYYGKCRELNYSNNFDLESDLKRDFVRYVNSVL